MPAVEVGRRTSGATKVVAAAAAAIGDADIAPRINPLHFTQVMLFWRKKQKIFFSPKKFGRIASSLTVRAILSTPCPEVA